jgi:hypothetical protein
MLSGRYLLDDESLTPSVRTFLMTHVMATMATMAAVAAVAAWRQTYLKK